MSITQSSKTIIFEQFSPGINYNTNEPTERLDYLLRKSPDEKLIREIEDVLGVSSYEEFLDKFKPVIYESKVSNPDTGEVFFKYSIDRPDESAVPIDITDQDFYKIANKIYDQKNSSGDNNLSFDYEDVMKLLTPENTIKEAKEMRRKLEYYTNKALAIEEKVPEDEELPEEYYEYSNIVYDIRGKIAEKFYNGRIVDILSIATADNQAKLNYLEEAKKNMSIGMNDVENGDSVRFIQCDMTFDENGNIKIEEVKASAAGSSDTKRLTETKQFLIDCISEDFDSIGSGDSFTKKCVLNTFCGADNLQVQSEGTLILGLNRDELIAKRDTYNRLYKNIQESFAEQMITLVERFLNVRAFFDHATIGKKTEKKVIIANCHITDLINDDKKEFFLEYINRLASQANDEKLWYMIVPAIYDSQFADAVRNRGGLRRSLNANDSEQGIGKGNLVSFNEFKKFMSDIKDAAKGVFTFFNFKGNEKTSFTSIESDRDIIKNFKEACGQINEDIKPFSVFCYPNFTVKSRAMGTFTFGKVTAINGERDITINFPGIYLDASYIACGLMAAAHNNEYLKAKNFKISSGDMVYPPVRLDFEGSIKINNNEASINELLITKMNRETTMGARDDVLSEIKENGGFGFAFTSDGHIGYDGKAVNNTYVFRARTLALENMADGNSEYRPIYKSMLKTFLNMMFKLNGSRNMENLIKKWNQTASKAFINSVVYDNDNINMETVNENGRNVAHISVTYGDANNVDEVVIDS